MALDLNETECADSAARSHKDVGALAGSGYRRAHDHLL